MNLKDFKASNIILSKDIHSVINSPLEKFGGPLFISTADGIFTMKNGDVNQKTIITKPNHNVRFGAYWYDECIYYENNSDGLKIYKLDMKTYSTSHFNSLTTYNSGHG